MTETEILRLKKPSASDFYSVADFNHNVDALESIAQAKVTTLRVCGDLNSAVLVIHSSGSYAGTVTEHSDDEHAYAEFVLPCGGHVDITHIVGGKKFEKIENLIDGKTEWIISHQMIAYHSILAKVPDGYFSTSTSIVVCDHNGVGKVIKKTNMATFQTGYTADLDHKNELWHAVRTGMLTASNYATITGETYPTTPPMRVEQ